MFNVRDNRFPERPPFPPPNVACSGSCAGGQLRLLLWKSVYLYRLRRNWAITALEVLTPLLLTVVQNYLRCNRLQRNVTGEEVLRQAFPSVRLESFPSEAEMVAKLSVRTNAVGLANNYGVVFERAEQGELSYTLRFPIVAGILHQADLRGQRPGNSHPFWMNGILLPMVSGLNLAVARAEAMRLNNPLPPVYFQTHRFPAPKAKGWGWWRASHRRPLRRVRLHRDCARRRQSASPMKSPSA
ncbi:hypothetical protein MRX96_038772 [Rhipicephalus microplus]